jgi:hypothetical protein
MVIRTAALLAVGATAALAQHDCPTLPDQGTQHIFRAHLENGNDDTSAWTGNVSYTCNYTTGGVIYNQNLVFSFFPKMMAGLIEVPDVNQSMYMAASA